MTKIHEYLVIGAGPAGLQLGYFLGRNGRDYLILERGSGPGTFFASYPRHRELISINKVHTGCADPATNLRWDWNSLLSDDPDLLFKRYSRKYFPAAEDMVRYLQDFARHFALNVQYDTDVVRVGHVGHVGHVGDEDGHFVVTDARGATYAGERLVVATGVSRAHVPDFPGVELCESYTDCSVDPADFVDQRVLIVGKGNSGFETANNLSETAAAIHMISPKSLQFAWQSHFVGHLRAVNNNFLDTYHLKSQNTVIDGSIDRIERVGDKLAVEIAFSHAQGQRQTVLYDRVILCTGFRFDASIFDETCRPELTINNRFPAQTPEWESVNVPGLYFAGTLMQMRDYRQTMSGFIHGFRHNVEALCHIFESTHHGRPWPRRQVPATPQGLLEAMVDRLVRGPGIFLQPGFLCDVVVVPEAAGEEAEYFEDVPLQYLHHGGFDQHLHYYTLTLEYGPKAADPFAVDRDPDPQKAHEAVYLHPVIRRYEQGSLVGVHHIHDDLENEWGKEELRAPARAFLTSYMEAPRLAAV